MLRVVLVEPERELNVGAAARAMKNFGCTDLWLVRPRCRLGFEAVKFAKHSKDVLDTAKTVKTLAAALKGIDFVAGTTGVVERYASNLKNLVELRELAKKLSPAESIAVVFGGESTGLSKKELFQCDAVAHIPASAGHPVLNLSHAVAVVLYEFFSAGLCDGESALEAKMRRKWRPAPRKDREHLEKLFADLVAAMPVVQNPRKVAFAFKNVLERARPSRDEVQTLLAAVGPLQRVAKKAH